MEPHQAIPKKHFVSEKQHNCGKEINLTPQERIGNIDWCKCGCKSKPMATFGESLCLLVWLKPRSVREASYHSAFMGNFPILVILVSLTDLVDEFFLLFLFQLNKMRTLGESKDLSFCFWFEGGENFQKCFILPQGLGAFPQSFHDRDGVIQ